KENIAVAPPLKQVQAKQYGTVGSLVMLKSAGDKSAAGKWINFATGADAARTSVGALYGGDPVLGELEKYVGTTTVGPLHEKARDVMGALAPEIQAAL